MRTYTIELHNYPQEFIICANSADEAIAEAKEIFGGSVYESKILDETGEITE